MKKIVNKLIDILKKELDAYKNILYITEKKTDIIISGEIKKLDKMTEIEQKMLLGVSKLEKEREACIKDMGIDLGEESINISHIIDDFDEEYRTKIEDLKDQLLDTLKKIKEKNDLNSRLIKDSLEYINLNLNLMTDTKAESNYSDKVDNKEVSQGRNLFDAKA